jgi:hypothetical protein
LKELRIWQGAELGFSGLMPCASAKPESAGILQIATFAKQIGEKEAAAN